VTVSIENRILVCQQFHNVAMSNDTCMLEQWLVGLVED
jgi:hypothetical protein